MDSIDDPSAVLVLRASGLGDLLVVVPALRALQQHHPDRPLVLATPAWLGWLALTSGAVDEILPTAGADALTWVRAQPPAVAVNLHGCGPQSHRGLDRTHPVERIGCRAAGWTGPDWADLAARHPHERTRWCALLETFGIPADPADLRLPAPPGAVGNGPAVIVHPGGGFGAKLWPADRFAAVAAALDRTDAPVVITGSAAERTLAEQVAGAAGLSPRRVLAGQTELPELARLVAGAGLVISGDTGIAHLASAYGTPSVVLFGPVPASRWGPPTDGPHIALSRDEARRGDPFAGDPDPALLGVTVADVLAAARSLGTAARDSVPTTLDGPARPRLRVHPPGLRDRVRPDPARPGWPRRPLGAG
ncbi:MAG TPA: glycosyltransferase family 9 protein [Pseudonocardia sp.]|nr:glycosyltransferase family 9 protein [Pseudonocardia sp.]